jgi:hypothetical protein
MPEQLFDPSTSGPPASAEDLVSYEGVPAGQRVHGSRAAARRRSSARKRDQRPEAAAAAKAKRERDELAMLEQQGFTPAEAIRLLRVTDPNQAVMRRLRFQRWLVEHGLLDEFSA